MPCSIRKGGVQRHRNKAGELVEYKAQPRLNFRNGLCIAALRAAIRSHLKISA